MPRSNLPVAPPLAEMSNRLSRAQRRRLERAARRRVNRGAVPLLARICLVAIFPFSGLDKIAHWNNALKQADSSIVPKAAGPAMLMAAMLVEFITPACIVLGWHDRLAAFVLAGYCVVSGLLYHRFWLYPDFWSPSDKEGNRHFWDFVKNFGIVGGLLLLLIGGDPVPLSDVLEDPLGSAPLSA